MFIAKALIFDFDGVLVESEGAAFKVLQESCMKNGFELTDDYLHKKMGKTSKSFLEEQFANNLSKSTLDKILQDFYLDYKSNINKYVKPITATIDFIKGYKGSIPLAIASMSTFEDVKKVCKNLNIFDKFRIITSKDSITRNKPDPEVFLKTAEKLKVATNFCVVFEDSVIGITAAHNAGMPCYLVKNSINSDLNIDEVKVCGVISSKEDILAITNKFSHE